MNVVVLDSCFSLSSGEGVARTVCDYVVDGVSRIVFCFGNRAAVAISEVLPFRLVDGNEGFSIGAGACFANQCFVCNIT